MSSSGDFFVRNLGLTSKNLNSKRLSELGKTKQVVDLMSVGHQIRLSGRVEH